MGLFSLTWLSLTYLTQRLEYRFHTARVIGSNPIVGKTGRNPCFCQHDSKHGLAARSQLNDQSIGCFLSEPSSTALLSASTKQVAPPSLLLFMYGLPVPNRRTGTGWRKARERVDTQLTSPLPQLGEDQGGQKPQRKPFTAPHDSFAKHSLRRFHSCPPKAKRFQDTRRPSESEQPRANLLESVLFVPFLSSNKNEKKKRIRIRFELYGPPRWLHMHACTWTSKKSGFKTWVALCNSIYLL